MKKSTTSDVTEQKRLKDACAIGAPWKKWGPYLSERQWGTVREDYSPNGDAWNFFTHEQSRSRAYRWGEDGIAGISDDKQHLCFSLALWNGNDPILKERLLGLTNSEGKHATLDDIADAELDHLAELGFDWIWLLSVWQTGPAAQKISRANSQWLKEFAQTLPDFRDEDIAGSGFAIQNFTVHRNLGGASALPGLRQRMRKRGLGLMLDFVPNHMAPDHPWVDEHPEYFVHGSEADLVRSPQPSRLRCTRLRQSLPSSHPGCISSIRDNSKGAGNVSLPIWQEVRKNPSTCVWQSFTTGCYLCCVIPW